MARKKRTPGQHAITAKCIRVRAGQFTEWIAPTDHRNHPIRCCDCGLIHVFQFGVMPDGSVAYRAKRASGLTRERRKHLARKRS